MGSTYRSCRVVSRRDEPSGIWAIPGCLSRSSASMMIGSCPTCSVTRRNICDSSLKPTSFASKWSHPAAATKRTHEAHELSIKTTPPCWRYNNRREQKVRVKNAVNSSAKVIRRPFSTDVLFQSNSFQAYVSINLRRHTAAIPPTWRQ